MKQNDKEILLKDLCARLPYGTMVYAQNSIDWYESELCTQVISDLVSEDYIIKPYLFPLSSMTEEQNKEYKSFSYHVEMNNLPDYEAEMVEVEYTPDLIDWYNENYFDYRGLIEKGLAIDATNLNIY